MAIARLLAFSLIIAVFSAPAASGAGLAGKGNGKQQDGRAETPKSERPALPIDEKISVFQDEGVCKEAEEGTESRDCAGELKEGAVPKKKNGEKSKKKF